MDAWDVLRELVNIRRDCREAIASGEIDQRESPAVYEAATQLWLSAERIIGHAINANLRILREISRSKADRDDDTAYWQFQQSWLNELRNDPESNGWKASDVECELENCTFQLAEIARESHLDRPDFSKIWLYLSGAGEGLEVGKWLSLVAIRGGARVDESSDEKQYLPKSDKQLGRRRLLQGDDLQLALSVIAEQIPKTESLDHACVRAAAELKKIRENLAASPKTLRRRWNENNPLDGQNSTG